LLARAEAQCRGQAPHRGEPAPGRSAGRGRRADRSLRRLRHLGRPAARRALRARLLVLGDASKGGYFEPMSPSSTHTTDYRSPTVSQLRVDLALALRAAAHYGLG